MTIDNHPQTPKPVDDRGAGVGYHQPTKADWAALEAIDDALGFLMDDVRALRPANSPGVAHVFSDEAGYLRMEGERDG